MKSSPRAILICILLSIAGSATGFLCVRAAALLADLVAAALGNAGGAT